MAIRRTTTRTTTRKIPVRVGGKTRQVPVRVTTKVTTTRSR